MHFRRNRVDPRATLDLTDIDIGPPPSQLPAPPRSHVPAPPPGHRQPPTAATTTTAMPVSRAGINGLAGLCMLALVMTGLGLPLPGGHLAADAILVVVGFQLGLGVTRLAGGSPMWLRRFWLSAVGPIAVPTVVAIGLVTGYWWWLDRLGPTEGRGALTSLAMITNLGPIIGNASFAATDHLWLISLIVQFAIAIPLAALVTRRKNGRHRMLQLAISLVAAVMVARLTMVLTGMAEPATLAQLTITRLDGLLLGVAVAVAPRSLVERIPAWAAPLAVVALVATFTLAPRPDQRPAVVLGLLIPVVAGAAAIIVASRTPARTDVLSRLLAGLGPRWLGERAISIYIWHHLFGMALDDMVTGDLFGAEWPGFSLFVTRLIFALAAGAASYRYLQLPVRTTVERLLGRRRRRPGTPTRSATDPRAGTGHALSPS